MASRNHRYRPNVSTYRDPGDGPFTTLQVRLSRRERASLDALRDGMKTRFNGRKPSLSKTISLLIEASKRVAV